MTNHSPPALLITIDTEGDDLWSRPREITTHNAAYLPRFQQLCERYGFKPTWLTNYEMVRCSGFRGFALDAIHRGAAEVGMHLHAWNSPPLVTLTEDDFAQQPYLVDFPAGVMRDKIAYLTDLLESTFGRKMISHRAGRWALDSTYAKLLIDAGYRVDCSVTPHVNWSAHRRTNGSCQECDYTHFPSHAYFLDPVRIDRAGKSQLLELPMTTRRPPLRGIASLFAGLGSRCGGGAPGRLIRYLFPAVTWLRPDGRNLRAMLDLLQQVRSEKFPYAQFMLHSSELMPGGSPRFATRDRIERLYRHLEQLFEAACGDFRGRTLAEFRDDFASQKDAIDGAHAVALK